MLSSETATAASLEWPPFVERLEAVLRHMREDQFLVISPKHSNRYVQFAAQGAFGLRAEAVSNAYLPPADRFDDKATAALLALGWHHPTRSPQESTPAADPHGSPNFFLGYSNPVPFAAMAELAARTLAEVMGVPHTGFLQYESFERNGGSLDWPRLDLRRVVPAPSPLDVRQQVLQALRQRTGIADLDCAGDGHLYLHAGSVPVRIRLNGSPRHAQIDSMLLKRIKTSRALMKRLNELNARLGPLHLFCDSQGVRAIADVPVEPFEPLHLAEALAKFCRVADGIDELLQAEFGGTTTFLEPMPSALKR